MELLALRVRDVPEELVQLRRLENARPSARRRPPSPAAELEGRGESRRARGPDAGVPLQLGRRRPGQPVQRHGIEKPLGGIPHAVRPRGGTEKQRDELGVGQGLGAYVLEPVVNGRGSRLRDASRPFASPFVAGRQGLPRRRRFGGRASVVCWRGRRRRPRGVVSRLRARATETRPSFSANSCDECRPALARLRESRRRSHPARRVLAP